MAPIGFYAYSSDSTHRADTIEAAIKSINERGAAKITGWPSLPIGGRVIINTILNRIKESDVFLCDLTGLNPNVMFELGYAIGLRKRVWLTLDTTRANSAELLRGMEMVYGFGYRSYTNSEQITHQFLGDIAYHDPKQHLLMDYDSWITGMLKALNATDVFYIPSSVESTAVTRLRDFFASLTRRNRRKVVVQDTLEDSHDPLRFYLRNMLDANSVIVHLDDPESAGASINNTKGLARNK